MSWDLNDYSVFWQLAFMESPCVLVSTFFDSVLKLGVLVKLLAGQD